MQRQYSVYSGVWTWHLSFSVLVLVLVRLSSNRFSVNDYHDHRTDSGLPASAKRPVYHVGMGHVYDTRAGVFCLCPRLDSDTGGGIAANCGSLALILSCIRIRQ